MMQRSDMEILEYELSRHLYDKFAREIQGRNLVEDLGARICEEMRLWRLEEGGLIPVNVWGNFRCLIQMSFGPEYAITPVTFEVKWVLEGEPDPWEGRKP